MTTTVDRADLDRLVDGTHHNPHALLGARPESRGRTVIRTLRPDATAVEVIVDGETAPMQQIHDAGVFEALLGGDVHGRALRECS